MPVRRVSVRCVAVRRVVMVIEKRKVEIPFRLSEPCAPVKGVRVHSRRRQSPLITLAAVDCGRLRRQQLDLHIGNHKPDQHPNHAHWLRGRLKSYDVILNDVVHREA
jgi:hypothetical protein